METSINSILYLHESRQKGVKRKEIVCRPKWYLMNRIYQAFDCVSCIVDWSLFFKKSFDTTWLHSVWKVRAAYPVLSETGGRKSRYESPHSIRQDSVADITWSLCCTEASSSWLKPGKKDSRYLSKNIQRTKNVIHF